MIANFAARDDACSLNMVCMSRRGGSPRHSSLSASVFLSALSVHGRGRPHLRSLGLALFLSGLSGLSLGLSGLSSQGLSALNFVDACAFAAAVMLTSSQC
jgi:hypothetical protein